VRHLNVLDPLAWAGQEQLTNEAQKMIVFAAYNSAAIKLLFVRFRVVEICSFACKT
jgi:hypothetical protein